MHIGFFIILPYYCFHWLPNTSVGLGKYWVDNNRGGSVQIPMEVEVCMLPSECASVLAVC